MPRVPGYYSVTPALLAPIVEQGEPSTEGEWYVLDLRGLLQEGFTHVQFHFPFTEEDDGNPQTDAASLIKE